MRKKDSKPKPDRAWFERQVAELGRALEKLPADRQEQLEQESPLDIRQDSASWQAGYAAGLAGQAPPTPPDVDGLSFQAGVIEGKADRQRLEPKK